MGLVYLFTVLGFTLISLKKIKLLMDWYEYTRAMDPIWSNYSDFTRHYLEK